MKLAALQEARYHKMKMEFWEQWGCSGGRGGASFSEFGFNYYETLPENLAYNIAWNNAKQVDFNTIISEAKEGLKYAIEDMNAGADMIDPEDDHKRFLEGVKQAKQQGGIAISTGADDCVWLFVTNVDRDSLEEMVEQYANNDKEYSMFPNSGGFNW